MYDKKTLRSWSLMLLLPDFMRQDLWDDWWERLSLLDVEIAGVTAARLRPDQIARLYARNQVRAAEPGRVDGTWLGRQLLCLDMAVPVLLRTRVPSLDLTAVLDRWKGTSAHRARADGDLRSISPLADRCQSLFHTPADDDDLVAALGEVFHGDVVAAIEAGTAARRLEPARLRDLRSQVAATEDPGPYDIVLRALLRALTLLDVDVHLRPGAAVTTAVRAVHEARGRLAGARGPATAGAARDELEALAPLVAAVPEPVLAVAGRSELESRELDRLAHRRTELRAAALLLCAPAGFGARVAHLVTDTLEGNGLALDDWERHRLTSAIAFFGPAAVPRVTARPQGRAAAAPAGERILVTGATGTVGARLVQELAQRPGLDSIVALTRSLRRVPPELSALDRVDWRETDLTDLTPRSLRDEGLTHVVHSAADVRWNLDLDTARQANVTTTARLVDALADAPGCRLVHVSTAFVVAEGSGGHRNTYERSKAEAEAVVRRAGMPVTIVRPTLVVGDGTTGAVTRPKGLYLLLRLLAAGRLPFLVGYPDAFIDVVSTDACAEGIVHAIDHDGCAGGILTVAEGARACTLQEVLERIVAAAAEVGHPVELPAIVGPARWGRLVGPLLRSQAADRREARELSIVDVFAPYLQFRQPVAVDNCPAAPVPKDFRTYAATVIGAQVGRRRRRPRRFPTRPCVGGECMTPTAAPPVEPALYDLLEAEVLDLWQRDAIGPRDRVAAARLLRVLLEIEGPASAGAADLLARSGVRDSWNAVFATRRAAAVARWVAPHLRPPVLDVLAGDGRVTRALADLGVAPLATTERAADYPEGSWAGGDIACAPFVDGLDLDGHGTLLVCAVLHHEADPGALLDRLAATLSRRWVVVENCTDDRYGDDFHQLIDVFFNRCLNEFGLHCVPEHRSAAAWHAELSRYGTVSHHERLDRVPGIPFPYDLFVVDRTPA